MTVGRVDVKRWKPHLEAARRAGQTVATYAKTKGLSKHTLYSARAMLRAGGDSLGASRRRKAARRPETTTARFTELKLAPTPGLSATRIEARLANGASLAIESNDSAQQLLLTALVALSGLR